MPEDPPSRLWAGRTAALLGILLVALTLRQAVAAVSPILDNIRVDIPLSSLAVGLLGTVPPILFALSGLTTPPVARRLGLERALVLALCLMVVGHLVRAVAPTFVVLLLGSIIALVGMGLGNVLLPAAVKRYFPDHIGGVTAAYAGILSVSTAVPGILAAPLADSIGWRFSLGIWSVTGVIALLPWISLLARHRRELAALATSEIPIESPPVGLEGRIRHSRTARAITAAFGVTALTIYAGFAWLPEILVDLTGMSHVRAGVMLAIYGFVGGPVALVVPLIVARMRNVGLLILVGVALLVAGFVGMLLAPATATLLWIILLGVGALLFPVCLTLINLRTRTHGGAVALSGFSQGLGYTMGAVGPLAVGLLHSLTGGWVGPLVFLLVASLVGIWPAIALAKPSFVEDELAAREPRSNARRRTLRGG